MVIFVTFDSDKKKMRVSLDLWAVVSSGLTHSVTAGSCGRKEAFWRVVLRLHV